MATKMSVRKEYLEYYIIRPTNGLSLDQIGTLILMWYADEYDYEVGKTITTDNLSPFFKKYNTWNKIMSRAKDVLLDEGMSRLDYAWENITSYELQLKTVKKRLQEFNKLIGTKKGDIDAQ